MAGSPAQLCCVPQGVVLSQLLGEFSWLTEETLLRGFDVGFSGQLRCLVQHTLSLLRAHVILLRIHRGDLVVVPRPGPGLTHLARLSAELLPTFLSEAVGGESRGRGWVGCGCRQRGPAPSLSPPPPACAVRGLLAGRVPPEGPWELQGIELLSQSELHRQILLLLHLLPQDLLLLQVRTPLGVLGPSWVVGRWLSPTLQPPVVYVVVALLFLWRGPWLSWGHTGVPLSSALPVFLLLLSGSAGPAHSVWAPGR